MIWEVGQDCRVTAVPEGRLYRPHLPPAKKERKEPAFPARLGTCWLQQRGRTRGRGGSTSDTEREDL